MKILKGARKIFRHLKGGYEKIVGPGGGSSENLYTSNPKGGGGLLKN